MELLKAEGNDLVGREYVIIFVIVGACKEDR